MSELTPCNFCNLRRMRRYAAKNNEVVTLRPGKLGGGDDGIPGVYAYVHKPGEEVDHKKHFAAWFMELTDYCCC